jgi:preprotein translocase subunit SecA
MLEILKKVFGTRNERLLKNYRKIVGKISAFEPELQKLSDGQFQKKTPEFRDRLNKGEALN